MTMTRLLIVTTSYRTLHFLAPFATHFRAKGWRVDAIAKDAPGCEFEDMFDHVWNVTWSRNPFSFPQLFAAVDRLQEVVAREHYQLVHVHTPVASFVARYALRNLRQRDAFKVIYTAHGFHFHRGQGKAKNAIFIALEKLAGRWTDYLIVINHEDEKAAQRYHIVPGARIHYMPGIGIDTSYYDPACVSGAEIACVREELHLAPETHLFLMIAEFNPGKWHCRALQAFSQIRRNDIHLAFAGLGPLMEPMKKLAFDLGIGNRVHFLGYRDDIPAIIRASVATILPSEREGLPRSVMESLSLEVPVIGADVRGIRDLLDDGTGILFDVSDVDALAHAMTWILDHPDQARAMAAQGRAKMARHDIRSILKLHEALYHEALGQVEQEYIPSIDFGGYSH
jgi:glycosyltransferase involved in cell wall biosynthesis